MDNQTTTIPTTPSPTREMMPWLQQPWNGPHAQSRNVLNDVSFLACFKKSFLRDLYEVIHLNVWKSLESFLGSILLRDWRNATNNPKNPDNPNNSGNDRNTHFLPWKVYLVWPKMECFQSYHVEVLETQCHYQVLSYSLFYMMYIWIRVFRLILKMQLMNLVSAVREDAGSSMWVLLRMYVNDDAAVAITSTTNREDRDNNRSNSKNIEDANAWIYKFIIWQSWAFLAENKEWFKQFSEQWRPDPISQISKKKMVALEGASVRGRALLDMCSSGIDNDDGWNWKLWKLWQHQKQWLWWVKLDDA